jgi:hypothetical protein
VSVFFGVRELAPDFAMPSISVKQFVWCHCVDLESGGKPPHSEIVGAPTFFRYVTIKIPYPLPLLLRMCGNDWTYGRPSWMYGNSWT